MKKIALLLMNFLAALLCFSPAIAFSARTPSFDLEWQLKESQAVVLATEGDVIDGKLTVLSTYRGNLKPGDEIHLPLLAEFNNPARRVVHPQRSKIAGVKKPTHAKVSGRLMVLFLTMKEGKVAPLIEPNYFHNICWIEGECVYAMSHANTTISDQRPLLMEHGLALAPFLSTISKAKANDQ